MRRRGIEAAKAHRPRRFPQPDLAQVEVAAIKNVGRKLRRARGPTKIQGKAVRAAANSPSLHAVIIAYMRSHRTRIEHSQAASESHWSATAVSLSDLSEAAHR